jgi:hypothetical protein
VQQGAVLVGHRFRLDGENAKSRRPKQCAEIVIDLGAGDRDWASPYGVGVEVLVAVAVGVAVAVRVGIGVAVRPT